LAALREELHRAAAAASDATVPHAERLAEDAATPGGTTIAPSFCSDRTGICEEPTPQPTRALDARSNELAAQLEETKWHL